MKYIKLGKAYIEDEVIKVVIEEQSHIGKEFGEKDRTFRSSSGFVLWSITCPVVSGKSDVGMRGSSGYKDEDPLGFTSLDTYNAFVKAVEEYNEYFSKPQVKEMTMADLEKLLGYPVKIKKEN